MKIDPIKATIFSLFLALMCLSQYTVGLSVRYERVLKQRELFLDQIYDVSISGCQGGANRIMLNFITNAPFKDDAQDACIKNARNAQENFKKSYYDWK